MSHPPALSAPSLVRLVARPRAALVPAVGLALMLGLSACAGASDTASSESGAAPAAAPGIERSDVGGSDSAAGVASIADNAYTAADKSATTTPARIARTADLVIQVDQLRTATARVRSVAESIGGSVASETTGYGDSPVPIIDPGVVGSEGDAKAQPVAPGESVLVLRVPEATMESALDRLAAVGAEQSRATTAQDVTGDIADLKSRLETQRRSVERVRALLAQATKIEDVVRIEGELATREAELEAASARSAALADRADLATVTVTLRTPAAETAADDGFVAGLKAGWDAVRASTRVVLTVLGALVPVAVIVTIVAAPLLWLRRRRRNAVATRSSAAAAPVAVTPAAPAPVAVTPAAPAPVAVSPVDAPDAPPAPSGPPPAP